MPLNPRPLPERTRPVFTNDDSAYAFRGLVFAFAIEIFFCTGLGFIVWLVYKLTR